MLDDIEKVIIEMFMAVLKKCSWHREKEKERWRKIEMSEAVIII